MKKEQGRRVEAASSDDAGEERRKQCCAFNEQWHGGIFNSEREREFC